MTARNTFVNNIPEFNFKPNPATVTILRHPTTKVSQLLLSCQKISIAMTAISFTCVGAVYGWNVHVQKKFDQQYNKLQTLKQNERQLIVANESLDHDLITNIDRLPVKLVPEKPQQSIFIVPAEPSPTKEMKAVSNDLSPKLFDPQGY
ncbi:hypothetical protein Syn7502_02523 [Synechococcus sp. PCC 7502]|uniref:hypothetical protein n=1 Tax=Synechococcus sp. PCC 7502 TaxID=1173263 RepID=UPI00029FB570|nr:hypothetical protein [Synechococcus sp. PCC 7502]AFY74495.1 hypothetical protein Syn7502_02523 [Synechococcus sp. PCC 7502]